MRSSGRYTSLKLIRAVIQSEVLDPVGLPVRAPSRGYSSNTAAFRNEHVDPFVSDDTTPSQHSIYLRDQSDQYPTALLDLNGNERASVQLRNNHINELHITLQRPADKDLPNEQPTAAIIRVSMRTLLAEN